MDPIAMAAGSALVAAMTTDMWERARDGVVELWQRVRPDRADAVSAELAEVRTRVLAAREDGDADTEDDLGASWGGRLQRLLQQDPQLREELRRLIEERLVPAVSPHEGQGARSISLSADARDGSVVIQAGHHTGDIRTHRP
ncbi:MULTISPECIES: hypothetical protein [unclassified Streptomyces]|uniref:hypothetical protein n=1 Tax=unclassified Streptomyces TaxID=2593676 RepID=UPI00386F13AC|nr:exocyst complex component EXO70 [Streptomyces sp. NBC_00827]